MYLDNKKSCCNQTIGIFLAFLLLFPPLPSCFEPPLAWSRAPLELASDPESWLSSLSSLSFIRLRKKQFYNYIYVMFYFRIYVNQDRYFQNDKRKV